MYKEEDNVTLKGDATIFFAKPESSLLNIFWLNSAIRLVRNAQNNWFYYLS